MATFELLTGEWLSAELRTDDTSVLFTSTRRNQAVNDGAAEFADLTECLIRQSTITCSCNTAEYNLTSSAVTSTDFVRIAAQGVEYSLTSSGSSPTLQVVAGDDFPRRDIEWLNRYQAGWRTSTTPVDLPRSYYLRADGGAYYLGLSEQPNIGSSEIGKLRVPYVARPDVMTSAGDIPFKISGVIRNDLVPFHRAIVHYAAHQLEKLRGDEEASDRQLAKFHEFVQRFVGKMRPKGGGFVTMARNYLKEASGRNPRGRVVDPYRDAY